MDDTNGVVASMFGVTGAGLRLSLLLNAVSCQVANLGVEIHSISKGISSFGYTLKQVGQIIQDPENAPKQEVLEKALQITQSARMVFDEIETMLDKVQKTSAQGHQAAEFILYRFRICFKKQRVTYLLAELEFLRLGLAVMLQVIHLGKMLTLKRSPSPPSDELFVHERAEAQNMIIVRYWAQKRLDRLWELSRQEALEGDACDTKQQPENSNTGVPPTNKKFDLTPVAEPYKYPLIRLGVDTSLNAIEDSPKDMLRITDQFLKEILKRWFNYINERKQLSLGRLDQTQTSRVPMVHVSSGSEEEDGYSSDDLDYSSSPRLIEGTTADWRKPHSQKARQEAARLRSEYSDYQASVESDMEYSTNPAAQKKMPKKTQTLEPTSSGTIPTNLDRGSANSLNDGLRDIQSDLPSPVREYDPRPYAHSGGRGQASGSEQGSPTLDRPQSDLQPRPPSRPHPHSQSQSKQQSQLHPQYHSQFPPQPSSHTQQYTASGARPIVHHPPNTGWHNQNASSQTRSPTASVSGSPLYINSSGFANYHPTRQSQSASSSYTGSTFTYPLGRTQTMSGQIPPRPSENSAIVATERHRSRSRKSRDQSSNRETSRERRDRYSRYRRSATKGILGVGAIAGFMEALEAFQLF